MLSRTTYCISSFLRASAMSVCETIAYLSNTLRVRQPPIFIMTPSAIPARWFRLSPVLLSQPLVESQFLSTFHLPQSGKSAVPFWEA